jgi:biopolymer transport protein TolR
MHMQSRGRKGKRNMNFELNLIPFIDVLSTCICFLLVTAIFINLGSFHVNQAIGSASTQSKDKPEGSVSVSLGDNGAIRFDVKDVKGAGAMTLEGNGGRIDFSRTDAWIKNFAARYAEVKTVLLMPNPRSKYDDLIQLMAQFKASQMDQIGIAPL